MKEINALPIGRGGLPLRIDAWATMKNERRTNEVGKKQALAKATSTEMTTDVEQPQARLGHSTSKRRRTSSSNGFLSGVRSE